MHAAAVCLDEAHQYQAIPGFAPLAVSWGWLLLGVILGACSVLVVLTMAGKLHQQPTVQQLGSLMAHGQGMQTAQQQARADALRYIALGGQPALREMAMASRMSEAAFLAHLTSSNPTGAMPNWQ